MKLSYDVVVVGAGPGGSTAARMAAEKGLGVLLLEKRQEIGTPVRCAEGTGTEVLQQYIDLEPAWIAQEINGGRIFAPNGTPVVLAVKGAGVVLERKIFDRRLAELAAKSGADILVKARVTGVIKSQDGKVDGVYFRYLGKDCVAKAKIVIAADGIESQVGRWAGIDTTHDLNDVDVCAQYLMANIDLEEPDYCDFYVGGEIAPRGYAWVFPKGERMANVGVGIGGIGSGKDSKFAIDYLNEFVKEKFPGGSILSQVLGSVSVGAGLPEVVADGIILVGDAAHHADPLSGGGILNAMIGGRLAAEVAAEAIQNGDVSKKFLQEYERRWDKEVGKTFKHLCRIRDAVLKFSDETLDKCAETLAKIPRDKLTVLHVFKTVLLNQPRLLLELRHLITAGWL